MARFIHITAEKNAGAIRRGGLKPQRFKGGGRAAGVYAMPVSPRFEITHQWGREIKRWSGRTLVAVTFMLPDDEPVLVGRFNGPLDAMPAARAAGVLHALSDARGWQVVVPRAVAAADVVRIRPIRRVTGWRYFPDAHGREPCGCPACVARGEPFQRKLRAAYDAQE